MDANGLCQFADQLDHLRTVKPQKEEVELKIQKLLHCWLFFGSFNQEFPIELHPESKHPVTGLQGRALPG